jgi:peptidyl-prolyl cis-trans isomerase B (cyclophilin B)
MVLFVAGVSLTACNNVLPPGLENKVRGKAQATKERERLLTELAVVTTEKGSFTIEFFGEDVPLSVAFVRKLIEERFYDGIRVHRMVRTPVPFLVQLGDPLTRGMPGKDFVWETSDDVDKPLAGFSAAPETVAFESSPHKNERGVVGLARRPSRKEAGSHLYILLERHPQLDGEYTVIGKIVAGMEIVDKLERGDAIKSVRLVKPKN